MKPILLCSLLFVFSLASFGQSRAVLNSVTIADGQTVSSAVNVKRLTVASIVTPASFEGTTITFQVSYDGETTWVPLHDSSGNVVTLTVASSRATYVADDVFKGVIFSLRLVAGSAQSGDSVVSIVLRGSD